MSVEISHPPTNAYDANAITSSSASWYTSVGIPLTSDSLSNLANSSLRIFTRSDAEYVDDMAVNPTMSAYSMLKKEKKTCTSRVLRKTYEIEFTPLNVHGKYGVRLYGRRIHFGKEETKSTCDTTRRKKIQFESDVTFFFWQDFIFHFGSGKHEYFKRIRHHIIVDDAATNDFSRNRATNLHSNIRHSSVSL